jgi:hypothetical protein
MCHALAEKISPQRIIKEEIKCKFLCDACQSQNYD